MEISDVIKLTKEDLKELGLKIAPTNRMLETIKELQNGNLVYP